MEKKQSSIDWFVEQLIPVEQYDRVMDMIEQAKAMHKEEIVEAYTECWMNDGGNGFHKVKEAESYYNETFGGNNEN